ncbi:probable metal-nicotianamine transporter YSL1 [Oryza brachyantha]|uniref:probable metal-nicotianamine transporter YSL1 n=1 Tax=Oryza brachyantha TaxID=4533 RepID=UPI001ADA37E5|nr:probable metal-nicotianamine transporter YSL1 [Oryza brachyantha]
MGDHAGGEPPEQEPPSVEAAFAWQPTPPWWRPVTARSVAASAVLGTVFSFMAMRTGLTAGVVPSFNMSASLLSFFAIKSWTRLMARCGVASPAFTRQENVVVQTCIISCSTLAIYGGFTSYLLAMNRTVAKSAGGVTDGQNVYTLHFGKIVAFLFLVGFSSLLCTLPLRKIMIVDYKLTYPSGSAIAGIVNSFHTPKGAATAKLQVNALFKSMAGSFMWAFFQWFYTGGDGCGFQAFPLFGLDAYKEKFFFDFSASLVGVGMICPHLINFSMLLGSVSSCLLIWPAIQTKQGEWYTDPSPTSFKGINGYKVPMGIAMVLGDCLFQLGAISIRAAQHYRKGWQGQGQRLAVGGAADGGDGEEQQWQAKYDERRRNHVFLNDGIPDHFAVAGYVALAALSMALVPRIFPQIRYQHVAVVYAVAPLLAFCNSYATGLMDWSLATVYGKLALFFVGAWVGAAAGGVIAGLAACGIMLLIIGNAAELMHDFKTGYLTLTSPVSMFASQAIGTALGCVINPGVFLTFQRLVGADHLGEAGALFSAPMAMVYRGLAVLSVDGLDTLPKHAAALCGACFAVGVCLDAAAAAARARRWRAGGWVPNPMAMAIPFFIGPTFAVDMCVGSLVLMAWRRADRQGASTLAVVVASGLICGDGLWALPSSVLAMLKVQPPICMKFLSSYQSQQMRDHFVAATSR